MTTREEDMIKHVVNANTHDFLLFFTDKGRVFRLKTYEVPSTLECKGRSYCKPSSATARRRNHFNHYSSEMMKRRLLFMCTFVVLLRRHQLSLQKRQELNGLIAINLDEGDQLKWVDSQMEIMKLLYQLS
jgi:DNA gyrase subunit A